MAKKNAKPSTDEVVQSILEVLKTYEAAHPKAVVDVYRHNSVSVRIRIIDPDFAGSDRVDRDTEIWRLLHLLPDEVQADITLLLLFTPKEAKKSFANMEFDNPVPSALA